jgi:HAD superfamily hydrolase (TIGR01509 family)
VTITHLITDCDGVLIDSEAVALRTLMHLLAPRVPDRNRLLTLIRPRLGLKLEALLIGIHNEFGLPPPDVPELARLRATVEQACDAEAQPIAGVREALQAIALPKAVASNSRHERVQALLARTGLAPLFTHIQTADRAGRPKPDPAVYLAAAAALGADPACCLVVEDSVTGVNAARAAGMRVLGFTGAGHIGDGQGARLRAAGAMAGFADMAELPRLTAQLAGSLK